jgi:putative transposase
MAKPASPRDTSVQTTGLEFLRRELRRKEEQLSELSALLRLALRKPSLSVGGRGRVHTGELRKQLLHLIHEAHAAGARFDETCQLLGLSSRTIQRWRKQHGGEDQRTLRHRAPSNRLSEDEQRRVLALLESREYQGLSPRQLVAKLADQGTYLASESTMYRLLRARRRAAARVEARPSEKRSPQLRFAHEPNQIWSWDISHLRGSVRGSRFYLYLVMDAFSRRIMGWHVSRVQSMHTAAGFIRRTYRANIPGRKSLLLHSDNGSPMRSTVMHTTLHRLGITPSFSRPRMSSDNTFCEAFFSTLKSQPTYPRTFSSLEEARGWMAHFVHWYNSQHLHSGISFITPDDRHFGRERELLASRQWTYERARSTRPERWSRAPRTWAPAGPSLIRASVVPANRESVPPTTVGDNPLDTQPTHYLPGSGSLVVAWTAGNG